MRILFILLFPIIFNGQVDTLLNEKLSDINDMTIQLYNSSIRHDAEINNIKLNLTQCHQVYISGLKTQLIGIGLFGISTPLYLNGNADLGKVVSISGGLLSIIGTIIVWQSHKYIGRAGVKR